MKESTKESVIAMTWALALRYLKEGKLVTRKNIPNFPYLWIKPATFIKESWCKDPILKFLVNNYGKPEPNFGEKILSADSNISAYFPDRNAIVSGYTVTAEDMLASDWTIVKFK